MDARCLKLYLQGVGWQVLFPKRTREDSDDGGDGEVALVPSHSIYPSWV